MSINLKPAGKKPKTAGFRKLTGLFCLLLMTLPAVGQNRTEVSFSASGELEDLLSERTGKILTSFNLADAKKVQPKIPGDWIATGAGRSLKELWSGRSFFCPETELRTNLIHRQDGRLEVRGIPVRMKTDADSTASEELVLVFTPAGKLESVYFGVENEKYTTLMSQGGTVSDIRRRQIILDFVENFRTAYNRKDLTYLKTVFSDNALIIVGHVVQVQKDNSGYLNENLGEQKVELIRQSKQDYLAALEQVFRKNQFIKVGFEEIEIVQHRKFNSVYGVTLLQYWNSAGYSDKGYLFLMIDFREEDKPLIHVRSWQPQKFTEPDSVISLGDFEIIE